MWLPVHREQRLLHEGPAAGTLSIIPAQACTDWDCWGGGGRAQRGRVVRAEAVAELGLGEASERTLTPYPWRHRSVVVCLFRNGGRLGARQATPLGTGRRAAGEDVGDDKGSEDHDRQGDELSDA